MYLIFTGLVFPEKTISGDRNNNIFTV
jgi:hypothetical protein